LLVEKDGWEDGCVLCFVVLLKMNDVEEFTIW
jgi:hypothetical protein